MMKGCEKSDVSKGLINLMGREIQTNLEDNFLFIAV
jgi:hypothetical protein